MKHGLFSILISVILITGCSREDEVGPIIQIEITENAVQLTNHRRFKVYYYVVDERFLGHTGVYPVGDDQPHLKALESFKIPFDEIQGYNPNDSERIRIYYWNSKIAGEEEQADEVRVVSIDIAYHSL